MNFIDKIVNELCDSANCREALAHYRKIGITLPQVTERGTTNFDKPHDNEDGFYKVEAYIYQYLGMHYQRNYSVFQKCKFVKHEKPCLFIDFGCGPMTSGLALIKCLGRTRAKDEVAYWGIDTSLRMLEKAGKINGYFRLFSDTKFSTNVIGGDSAYGKMAIQNDFSSDCIIVFNFSCVLSQMTLKGNDPVREILNAITKISGYALGEKECPMYFIYQNPLARATMDAKMHGNWRKIEQQLTAKFEVKNKHAGVCEYLSNEKVKKVCYSEICVGPKQPGH